MFDIVASKDYREFMVQNGIEQCLRESRFVCNGR